MDYGKKYKFQYLGDSWQVRFLLFLIENKKKNFRFQVLSLYDTYNERV